MVESLGKKYSVALCTFNGEKFVEKQVSSILHQTTIPDEIIICDDVSTDNTKAIIEDIILNKNNTSCDIYLYKNSKNIGVTKNFEQAIKRCSGDIVFLSDQDDIWIPSKIEKILTYFNHNSRCNVVFTDASLIDKDGSLIADSLWRGIGFLEKNQYYLSDFLGRRFVTGATIAARKDFLLSIMPFPEYWIHDAWISICASIDSCIYSLPMRLIEYRIHQNNVIGIDNEYLMSKAMRRISNVNQTIKDKNKMYMRFKVVQERLNLSQEQKLMVEKCIVYWEKMCKLFSQNKIKSIITIISELTIGNYKRYHTGYRGAINDIASVLLYKKGKNYEYN